MSIRRTKLIYCKLASTARKKAGGRIVQRVEPGVFRAFDSERDRAAWRFENQKTGRLGNG